MAKPNDQCYRRPMMSDLGHMRGILARWLFALAVIAAVQQSAIPRGYMLDRSDSGQLAVVLCTGQGSITRWLDLESGELSEEPGDGQTGNTAQHCAFAAATSLLALPQVADLAPPPNDLPLATPARTVRVAVARQQARPPARGPPATL